jgi:hypothetical protein
MHAKKSRHIRHGHTVGHQGQGLSAQENSLLDFSGTEQRLQSTPLVGR